MPLPNGPLGCIQRSRVHALSKRPGQSFEKTALSGFAVEHLLPARRPQTCQQGLPNDGGRRLRSPGGCRPARATHGQRTAFRLASSKAPHWRHRAAARKTQFPRPARFAHSNCENIRLDKIGPAPDRGCDISLPQQVCWQPKRTGPTDRDRLDSRSRKSCACQRENRQTNPAVAQCRSSRKSRCRYRAQPRATAWQALRADPACQSPIWRHRSTASMRSHA